MDMDRCPSNNVFWSASQLLMDEIVSKRGLGADSEEGVCYLSMGKYIPPRWPNGLVIFEELQYLFN